jgi:NADPH:quinone reductase-like Zn-dependent oxidoreductase
MASSINSGDERTMRAKPFFIRLMGLGVFRPKRKVPGIDIAGRIEQTGRAVAQFSAGDEVYGDIYSAGSGAWAEYVCVPEDASIAAKPANMTFEQAAAVPVAGVTALQALRDYGGIREGQKVLINGASGGVGTFAVTLAKSFGAEVTGVCSTRNADLVSSIGADYVVDYKKQDLTQTGRRYDLIIDVAATVPPKAYAQMLSPGGRGVMVGFSSLAHMLSAKREGKKEKTDGIRVVAMGMAQTNKRDLLDLKELMEAGRITSVIDRTYPLGRAAEAMRYFEEEHARAKVVITMDEGRE